MSPATIGVVVIGRNEGERLRACLTSVDTIPRVYVDSGSTDGSRALASQLGFAVIDLDRAEGFTAARARNAGFQWLQGHHPDLTFIQTVDGDCQLHNGWLDIARADLEQDPRRAVVFGRRRERRPRRNAYHMACDDEWDVALGEVGSCGGDALFRVDALRQVNGFNDLLIAGEEPDLCLRLRQKGWQVWSNGSEMTLHDVAMEHFGQWYRRSRRTGYAIAELVDLHGNNADPSWRRLLASALGWTLINLAAFPSLAVLLVSSDPMVQMASAVLPLLSAVQIGRLMRKKRAQFGVAGAVRWAFLIMSAKAAQAHGWLQFRARDLTRRRAELIEYKT